MWSSGNSTTWLTHLLIRLFSYFYRNIRLWHFSRWESSSLVAGGELISLACLVGSVGQCFSPSNNKLPILSIEWFSNESRKVIGFPLNTLHDWLKNPRFFFIQSEVKPKLIVTRSNSYTWITSSWLVHWVDYVLCDWLEWLLWFLFYDTHWKPLLLLYV